MLSDAVRFIQQNDDFTVAAHIAPDGDCLGAALALTHLLRRMGKRAVAVCTDPVPHTFEFLPKASEVLLAENAPSTPAVIAVDCADLGRMGKSAALLEKAEYTLNIDHHGTNTEFAKINHVEPTAAATGEIIYRLTLLLGFEPDAEEASCLYTAIMTDTGNFAYSNTTPETLRIAASLIAAGADNSALNILVYRTVPFCKQKLLGLALCRTALHENGRIGIACLTLEDIASCSASGTDTDGIVENIRDIEGVEIAVTVRETVSDGCKVSLRSKEYANVGDIALRLGGGGHIRAAGATVHDTIAFAHDAVLTLAKEALKR